MPDPEVLLVLPAWISLPFPFDSRIGGALQERTRRPMCCFLTSFLVPIPTLHQPL